jgi:hypothetical protein
MSERKDQENSINPQETNSSPERGSERWQPQTSLNEGCLLLTGLGTTASAGTFIWAVQANNAEELVNRSLIFAATLGATLIASHFTVSV